MFSERRNNYGEGEGEKAKDDRMEKKKKERKGREEKKKGRKGEKKWEKLEKSGELIGWNQKRRQFIDKVAKTSMRISGREGKQQKGKKEKASKQSD